MACLACDRLRAIEEGAYPYAVARTETGYVQLAETQYYPGYVEFVAKDCVRELHDLDPPRRAKHLLEMSLVAEAAFRAFRPIKMNYEALGNSVPHLHWHLIPRHVGDPHLGGPAWRDEAFVHAMKSQAARPSPTDLETRRQQLLAELQRLNLELERVFR